MKKDLTFEEWMRQVDNWLIRKIGLTSECLPDYCYRDCWLAGDSPAEAADAAFEYMQES